MIGDGDRAALAAHREEWESRWARAERSRRPVPDQVRMAWEERWFPRGARLLDVGCGSGEMAGWLAKSGYRVIGIDFSRSAIERARAAHAGVPRLQFVEHDICGAPPPGGPFSALLDWGCLHGLPDIGKELYAHHLAAVSGEDARLLVFHPAPPAAAATVIGAIEKRLRPEFELADAEECLAPWRTKVRPGVALRFRRRPRTGR